MANVGKFTWQLFGLDNQISKLMDLSIDPDTGEIIDSDLYSRIADLNFEKDEVLEDVIDFKINSEVIMGAIKMRIELLKKHLAQVSSGYEIAKQVMREQLSDSAPKKVLTSGRIHWTTTTETIIDEESALDDLNNLKSLELSEGVDLVKVEYSFKRTGFKKLPAEIVKKLGYVRFEKKKNPVITPNKLKFYDPDENENIKENQNG